MTLGWINETDAEDTCPILPTLLRDGALFMSQVIAISLIALIRLYRWVRPSWLATCRYHPTCSIYAWQSITLYGPWRGTMKAILRLLRCQPLFPGGMDFV